MNRGAFTMVELVFIIVILGILGAIAVPKMAASRDDACITKLRGEVAALRSQLKLSASGKFLKGGSGADVPSDKDMKDKFLQSLDGNQSCQWTASGNKYTAKVGANTTVFTLDTTEATFDCSDTNALCQKLTGRSN